MRPPVTTVLLLPFCAALLTACAAPAQPRVVTEIRVVRVEIPAQLLTCKDAPAPPARGTQRDVARCLVETGEAGEDCRVKLRRVRALSGDRKSNRLNSSH